jgi:hypothetical protein
MLLEEAHEVIADEASGAGDEDPYLLRHLMLR